MPNPDLPSNLYVSLPEAARLFKCSYSWIYELVCVRKVIPHIRVGSVTRRRTKNPVILGTDLLRVQRIVEDFANRGRGRPRRKVPFPMPASPPFHELMRVSEIMAKCTGLSPQTIRYIRAQLLDVLKSPPTPSAPKDSAPDVAAAQAKTRELFATSGAKNTE